MTFSPRPYQADDLATLRDNNYTGLLAVEPGGGKTITSLMAVKDSGASTTLVVAPQGTHKSAWDKDAKLVMGQEVRVIGNSLKAQKQALFDFEWGVPGIYAVTPELFSRSTTDISRWAPDMLIVDEVHTLTAANKSGQRRLSGYAVSDRPISYRSGMRLALSGTPLRNSFERAWSIARFLHPDMNKRGEVAYDNYYGWLGERMSSEDIPIGFKWVPCSWDDYHGRGKDTYGKVIEGVPHLGQTAKTAKKWLVEKEPGRLFSEMPCVIQHFRRRECCVHHPEGFLEQDEPNVITRVVELAPKQKRVIKELEEQGLTWLDEHPLSVDIPLTLQQRIRQACLGVPKVIPTGIFDEEGIEKIEVDFDPDTVSSFADEAEKVLESWDEEPALIFMSSQRFAKALTARLNKKGISAFEYSGKTKKERDESMTGFGTKYRVMVATLESAGTGLDGLQKICKNEIVLERSVDETINIQGEGRLDRLGAIGQVQRVYIQDDMGFAAGRFSTQLTKRLELAKSTEVRKR